MTTPYLILTDHEAADGDVLIPLDGENVIEVWRVVDVDEESDVDDSCTVVRFRGKEYRVLESPTEIKQQIREKLESTS